MIKKKKKKLSQVLGILIFYKLEPAKSEFLFSPEDNQLDWTGSLKNKIAAKLLIVTAKLFCNLVEPSNHVIFFSVEIILGIVRKGKGNWTESNTIPYRAELHGTGFILSEVSILINQILESKDQRWLWLVLTHWLHLNWKLFAVVASVQLKKQEQPQAVKK